MVIKQDDLIKIIKLGRLHFLVAGFILYSLGALFAALIINDFSWMKFLFAYAVLMPAHLSVSYSNDYFDRDADLFNRSTKLTGGSGILLENPAMIPFSYHFALSLIGTSLLLSLAFAWYFSTIEIFLWALIGNLIGWFYTAPPLKFSYRGLGEFATVLTGLIIPGFGYLAISGFIDTNILLFCIPLMIFQLLFILNVEIPDQEADVMGGKNNLIVRYGRELGFILMGLCAISGSLVLVFLFMSGIFPVVIDYRIIAALCMILIVPSSYGLIKKPLQREKATSLCFFILNSLIFLGLAINIYFSYLLIFS